ncbi:MAG: hypothetical protein LBG88_00290 [Christensenellaceae bacterium]|nr:hypothetical protein [Christensenellaceae bacterium]
MNRKNFKFKKWNEGVGIELHIFGIISIGFLSFLLEESISQHNETYAIAAVFIFIQLVMIEYLYHKPRHRKKKEIETDKQKTPE